MPQDAHPKPKIDNGDFVHLFEMKRYFIADLPSLVAQAKITKADLLGVASGQDKEITGARVRALLRNEPVTFEHAKIFVTAINSLLDSRGYSKQKLEPSDSIEGAFFVIEGLAASMTVRQIQSAALAAAARYPETLVTAAEQGYRLTLSTALDLVRTLNSLPSAGVAALDPLECIKSDHRKGRKAAANGCLSYRDGYVKWPPDTLLETDMPRLASDSNVTSLRPKR